MHRVFLYLLLPAWLCFSVAYAQFNSFPPGVFTNKAAHDPAPAAAGVTLSVAGTEVHTAANTTVAYTGITVASGDTTLMATFLFDNSTAGTGLTAVWDGVGANQSVTNIIADSSGVINIFCLQNPTAGAKTLTFSWTGSKPSFVAAASFKGSSTGCQNAAATTVGFPLATLSITSGTGHIVSAQGSSGGAMGTLTSAPDTCPTSAPTCILYLDTANGVALNAYSEIAAGSGTVVIGSGLPVTYMTGVDIAP
jgi:hypothetical protein